MIAASSRAERDAFELWKRLSPDDAYVAGIDACVGKFFVPTPSNVRRAQRQAAEIRASTKDATLRKFIDSMETQLVLPEPSRVPERMVASFFGYMVKEGVRRDHMGRLADASAKALDAERRRLAGKTWPPGMRILVQLAASGLVQIVETVEKELAAASEAKDALASVRRLRDALSRYQDAFAMPGFRPEATFEDTFAFLKEHGSDLGRSKSYARALRNLWDYGETPAQVETAGLRMLRRELPQLRALTESTARNLGCAPSPESIAVALRSKHGLRPDQVLPFLAAIREPCRKVANKHVVGINPDYTTLVIETPPYLVNTTPSGAAYSLDSLTDHSREVFMATTDERSAARPPPAELLNLLVHEEYGHCVHGSNSAHAFAGMPRLVDVLNSPLGCVSEGIAFQRELEFVPVMRGIAAGDLDGPEEGAFCEALESWGGIATVAAHYEFLTSVWRIVRFLRVIGDARVNSGKQNLVAFVEWAHKATRLEKATIYYNVFPAHQILGAGYASTYAIIGERIRAAQLQAAKRRIPLRELNAYASSIGWPPKSIFEAKLKAWIAEHTG